MQRTLRTQSGRTSGARWTWLLLVLAAFAIYPALTQNIGALSYDAGTVHIYQGAVYSAAVSEGHLYPRWVQFLHLGLGSPLFTFRTPLAYAGMDLLFRLGLAHPVGWRVLTAVGLLAASVGAYLLVTELTRRKWAGLIAAMAFLYAPYVLRNAFERGSPEALGASLYPWIIWALVRLAKTPTGGWFLLASALWAGCIFAHVLAPLMLAPIALLVAVILAWRYRTASPLLALLAGILLTAFIWAPMLAEQRWVHVERDFQQTYASPASNPLALDSLLAAPAVYDVMRDDNSTGDRVGLWHALWLVLAIPAAVYAWRRGRRDLALVIAVAAVIGILLFWLLTGASDPIWRLLAPVLTRLQYRFRWMGLLSLAVAVIAGLCVALVPTRQQALVSLLLSGLLILTALPSLYVGLQHRYAPFDNSVSLEQVREAEIASGGTAFTYFGEFMPRWRTLPLDKTFAEQLGPMFDPAVQPLAEPGAGVAVISAHVGTASWDLTLQADRSQTVTLHLLYYPRWKAAVDGQPVVLNPQQETGFAQLEVPAGVHRISLRYGATAAETAGWLLSLLTLTILVVLAVRSRMTREKVSPVPAIAGPSPAVGPSAESGRTSGSAPSWWLLIGLTALFGFKVFFVDGHTTWLRCVSTPSKVCDARVSVEVPFAGGPTLRGYSAPGTRLRPGQDVRVTLVWRGEPTQTDGATAEPARRLASFVHIRNSRKDGPANPRTGNELWAQDEHETPAGLLTTEYLPGRLYVDEFRIRLPDDIPPGEYFLEAGLADLVAGEQLDPQADAVKPPLEVLWRSILLPNLTVTG
jgi:hypothetical protein